MSTFVRYATDEIEPPNRKVFETASAAKADFERVRRVIGTGEYELGLLFHLPEITDVREAARIVDDRLAGRPVDVAVICLEIEQSSRRRMRDLINTTFNDLDLSGLDDIIAAKGKQDEA